MRNRNSNPDSIYPADDELPLFRPKFGRGRRPPPGDGRFRDAVLRTARAGRAAKRSLRTGLRRLRVGLAPASAHTRRAIVKVHYVRMTPYGAKAAALHLRYIERDGVEKDGQKGILYDADGPARAASFEEPRQGERHQFRLIVSPEDAHELDLAAYVRTLMARVERDLGRKLEWAAVNHYDTPHPHAHVVVRGVDRDGREVRFDRAYVARGLSGRAQEIATAELGPRPQADVDRALTREATQERFTSLDRAIERRTRAVGGALEVAVRGGVLPESPRDLARESWLLARLRHLEAMRLATRTSPTCWRLAPGWAQTLRDLGARGDILAQMHRDLRGDPSRYRIVDRDGLERLLAAGAVLRGQVAGKGFADELRGRFYLAVETPDGLGYRIEVGPHTAETVRRGDLVTIRMAPPRPDDRSPPGTSREPRPCPVVHRETMTLDAQRAHRGPTWLDRIAPETLAPCGLGARLREVLRRRDAELRTMAIDPRGPHKLLALREVERRDLGNAVAARTGRKFLAQTPDGFRGCVEAIEAARGYLLVRDADRFVVAAATAELRANLGKTVVLTRGRCRQLEVPPPERKR